MRAGISLLPESAHAISHDHLFSGAIQPARTGNRNLDNACMYEPGTQTLTTPLYNVLVTCHYDPPPVTLQIVVSYLIIRFRNIFSRHKERSTANTVENLRVNLDVLSKLCILEIPPNTLRIFLFTLILDLVLYRLESNPPPLRFPLTILAPLIVLPNATSLLWQPMGIHGHSSQTKHTAVN